MMDKPFGYDGRVNIFQYKANDADTKADLGKMEWIFFIYSL
jgi:hypothetical protein